MHFSNTYDMFVVSLMRRFVSAIVYFCINLIRERTVGNPSAIEGQTVNIKNLRTGLWA